MELGKNEPQKVRSLASEGQAGTGLAEELPRELESRREAVVIGDGEIGDGGGGGDLTEESGPFGPGMMMVEWRRVGRVGFGGEGGGLGLKVFFEFERGGWGMGRRRRRREAVEMGGGGREEEEEEFVVVVVVAAEKSERSGEVE